MPIFPFNNNPFRIFVPKKGGISFVPKGAVVFYGKRRNPKDEWLTKDSPNYAARMFVGLSVGNKPVFSVADVVNKVRTFLRKNNWKEDSSFIAQAGVYTEDEPDTKRRVVCEKSVQVVLFKGDSGTEPDFRRIVENLALHLCEVFRQKAVIVDYQRNGISKHVWNIYK
jgi:hypothetical protein